MTQDEILLVLAIGNGTFIIVGLGLYFGSKYIDRMLSLPRRDPKEPLVRRMRP